jgi:hypothetical protein
MSDSTTMSPTRNPGFTSMALTERLPSATCTRDASPAALVTVKWVAQLENHRAGLDGRTRAKQDTFDAAVGCGRKPPRALGDKRAEAADLPHDVAALDGVGHAVLASLRAKRTPYEGTGQRECGPETVGPSSSHRDQCPFVGRSRPMSRSDPDPPPADVRCRADLP